MNAMTKESIQTMQSEMQSIKKNVQRLAAALASSASSYEFGDIADRLKKMAGGPSLLDRVLGRTKPYVLWRGRRALKRGWHRIEDHPTAAVATIAFLGLAVGFLVHKRQR